MVASSRYALLCGRSRVPRHACRLALGLVGAWPQLCTSSIPFPAGHITPALIGCVENPGRGTDAPPRHPLRPEIRPSGGLLRGEDASAATRAGQELVFRLCS